MLWFILFVFIALAAVVFNFGPDLLRWFFATLEEWQEIIEDAKSEK